MKTMTTEERQKMSWELFDALLKHYHHLLTKEPHKLNGSIMTAIANFLRHNGVTISNLKKNPGACGEAVAELQDELEEYDFSDLDEVAPEDVQ